MRGGNHEGPVGPASNGHHATSFHTLLRAPELTFLMEAHDGLSARIAEAEGFKAIWASGLSISTALGLRDSNEAAWSQILDVVAFMADAVSIPIVVDGDSGHGNFNSARRFARRAQQIGAAAVCYEDKVFPKMNSFVGSAHELIPVDTFCGTLAATKEAVGDEGFSVIARTEALIAGQGLDEALRRAEAYRRAGADAIFIHSRQKVASEILAFAEAWGDRLPLVIAPTTYATTPTDEFRRAGISAVIWANHNMRAAFAAMRRTCREIRARESVQDIDDIAPLAQVFELLEYDELERTEMRVMAAGLDAEPLDGPAPSSTGHAR